MTVLARGPVLISDALLSLGDLVRIARGAQVEMSPAAVRRILAGRAVVDEMIAGPELVYGLNTGLGHLRNERLPVEALVVYQDAIVSSHASGIGDPLPSDVVRAAMAARLNGIARGGSGASLAVAEVLVAMLNAGVHPIVPEVGSVGASDLMHMAAIAEVALGRGRAEVRGDVVDGATALRRAGIEPLRMAPKDGLAFISANAVAIGHGALVAIRAAEVARLADVVLAISLESIRGNPSIVDPAVAVAKGILGQTEAADHIRALLAGSRLCVAADPVSVQDPLSFRVAPQVHGALREWIAVATRAVESELNASDDNPLVSVADARMISNGNFHPIVLALAFDALRPALAHVGQLSERRMNHLWSAIFADPDALLSDGFLSLMRENRGPLFRYAAAIRYTDLRYLAAPASLDVPPLDMGVEDHATNAPETVRRTAEALDALEDILAVEMTMAQSVIDRLGARDNLGLGARVALHELDGLVDEVPADRPASEVLAAIRTGLRPVVVVAVESAVEAALEAALGSS